MREQPQFNIETFLILSGSDLQDYAEPFVNENQDAIPESVFGAMKAILLDLDDEHMVYALEVCMIVNPSKFITCAVKFLSHHESAICCTAFRIMERLPQDLLTNELIEQITNVPVIDLFTTHVRTGEKVRIGSNEKFICSLLSKLT